MSNVKWAVVFFWVENDNLISEIWDDSISTLQEAEKIRLENLNIEPGILPQNLQVIQYTDS